MSEVPVVISWAEYRLRRRLRERARAECSGRASSGLRERGRRVRKEERREAAAVEKQMVETAQDVLATVVDRPSVPSRFPAKPLGLEVALACLASVGHRARRATAAERMGV